MHDYSVRLCIVVHQLTHTHTLFTNKYSSDSDRHVIQGIELNLSTHSVIRHLQTFALYLSQSAPMFKLYYIFSLLYSGLKHETGRGTGSLKVEVACRLPGSEKMKDQPQGGREQGGEELQSAQSSDSGVPAGTFGSSTVSDENQ